MKTKKSEQNNEKSKNTFLSAKNKNVIYNIKLNLLNLNRNVVIYNKIKENCSSKKISEKLHDQKVSSNDCRKTPKIPKNFSEKPKADVYFLLV